MASHPRRMLAGALAANDRTAGAPPRCGRPPAFLPLDFESVLPAQWFAGHRIALQPAKRLMLAVLADALELVLQDPAPAGTRRAVHQQEAGAWLRADDPDSLFGFPTVCETLGLDAKRLRAAIVRLVEARDAPVPRSSTRRRNGTRVQ
jgi:hypothetical protein